MHQAFVVTVDGDAEDPFGLILADDVLIEFFDEFARREHLVEQLLAGATAPPFCSRID